MEPKHLSWSQINTLHRCGEQYRRSYIEREISPPGVALLRGRATHKAQERNLLTKLETGELLEPEEVRQIASDAFDSELDAEYVIDGNYGAMVEDGQTEDQVVGFARTEAVELAGFHAEKVAPEIDPTAIEVRIEIPPSESLPVEFVSILDVIHRDTTILDTKTTAKSPSRDQAHTSEQLTSQGLAFTARYGREPEGLALDYLVRTPKRGDLKHVRLPTTRTRQDMRSFVFRANAALRSIQEEVFLPAPTDSWQCSEKFCGYTQDCPFFRGRPRPTN